MNVKFAKFCFSYKVPFFESGMAVFAGSKCNDVKVIESLLIVQDMLKSKIRWHFKSRLYRLFVNWNTISMVITLAQLIDEFIQAYIDSYINPGQNKKWLNL